MNVTRNALDPAKLNPDAGLPFELRLEDFRLAVQDVYDFFYDVNTGLSAKGLERLDDTLRPAIMSGVLSDMLTASLAKRSRTLTVNGDAACARHSQAAQQLGLPRLVRVVHFGSTRKAARRAIAFAARLKYAGSRSMPTL